MNKLLKWDTELFLFLNGLGGERWDHFWLMVSEVEIWFPLYAVLLFLLIRFKDRRDWLLALLVIVFNVVLTDQGSVQLFKEQFMRLRPCHVEALQDQLRLVKEGCGGKYGFISSHASNTFGLAVLLGLLLRERFPKLIYLLLLWATVVSFSRIYLGVHYPLDILGGALFGTFCGLLMHASYGFLMNRFS